MRSVNEEQETETARRMLDKLRNGPFLGENGEVLGSYASFTSRRYSVLPQIVSHFSAIYPDGIQKANKAQ
jgi:hypothetical protein